MATRSFLFYNVLFSLCYFNGVRVVANPSQADQLKCSGSSGGTQGLKVTYRRSPCSPRGQGNLAPNPRQILINDQARVDSINSRDSTRTYFTSQLKEKQNLPIKGSPLAAGVFFVKVGFGTPEHDFKLLLDTGSSLTWVKCKQCSTGCNMKQNIFNPSASSTFSNTSCNLPSEKEYQMKYADSTESEGFYGCDTITLSSTKYPNFLFGCGEVYSKNFSDVDGVLGLTSDSRAISKFGKPFCYCLPAKENSEGYLHFGQKALANCRTDKSISLLVKSGKKYYYFVNLIGITVEGKRLEISSNFPSNPQTIIDSGTVITRLPSSVYSELRSVFTKSMSKYPSAEPVEILDTCYNLEGYDNPMIPVVTLHFDNSIDMVLDKETVLYQADDEPGQVFCLAFAKAESYNIIGSHQQRKLDILYDIQKGNLGFGRGSCGN